MLDENEVHSDNKLSPPAPALLFMLLFKPPDLVEMRDISVDHNVDCVVQSIHDDYEAVQGCWENTKRTAHSLLYGARASTLDTHLKFEQVDGELHRKRTHHLHGKFLHSVELTEHLMATQMNMSGTLQSNRAGTPVAVVEANLRKAEYINRHKGDMTVMKKAWMSGVDRKNQIMPYNSTPQKSLRFHLVNAALWNTLPCKDGQLTAMSPLQGNQQHQAPEHAVWAVYARVFFNIWHNNIRLQSLYNMFNLWRREEHAVWAVYARVFFNIWHNNIRLQSLYNMFNLWRREEHAVWAVYARVFFNIWHNNIRLQSLYNMFNLWIRQEHAVWAMYARMFFNIWHNNIRLQSLYNMFNLWIRQEHAVWAMYARMFFNIWHNKMD
ncbi:hypothetical protein J6590_080794 [Homalodisca vitripennis]|nr:hypothetical protein J6590_080794 [Homalodisca vitripennis]